MIDELRVVGFGGSGIEGGSEIVVERGVGETGFSEEVRIRFLDVFWDWVFEINERVTVIEDIYSIFFVKSFFVVDSILAECQVPVSESESLGIKFESFQVIEDFLFESVLFGLVYEEVVE